MVTCEHCGKENENFHRFCPNCGASRSAKATPADLDLLIQKRVDALLERQVKSRDLVEAEALHFIEKRVHGVFKWAGPILAVFALGVGAFGFLTYGDIEEKRKDIAGTVMESRSMVLDVRQAGDDARTELDREVQVIKGRWEEARVRAEKLTAQLKAKVPEIEDVIAQAEKKASSYHNLTKDLEGRFRTMERNWREFDKQKETIEKMLETLGEAQTTNNRARYNVVIHYADKWEQVRDVVEKIWEALQAQGFQIGAVNTVPRSVDEDEIWFYHGLSRTDVGLIGETLVALGDKRLPHELPPKLVTPAPRGSEDDIVIRLAKSNAVAKAG